MSLSRERSLYDRYEMIIKGWRDVLTVPEPEVDAALVVGTSPGQTYAAQCYVANALYVLTHQDVPDVHLCHGVVTLRTEWYQEEHAWVEIGEGLVFQAVVQKFFPTRTYYAQFGCVVEVRYSARGIEQLLRLDPAYYGPWHLGDWRREREEKKAAIQRALAAYHGQRQP